LEGFGQTLMLKFGLNPRKIAPKVSQNILNRGLILDALALKVDETTGRKDEVEADQVRLKTKF